STDFPAVNPTQAAYGGGASDGFLYRLDGQGQVAFSTWIGGSGADRVSFVNFDLNSNVIFSGETDSVTMPFSTRVTGSLAGPFHGFWATMSEQVVHASGVMVGKDLMATITARLSDFDSSIGAPVAISSGDPQSVLVADIGDNGQGSIILAHAPTG